MSNPSAWLQFWNQEQSVYVSQRHIVSNYRAIADDFLALEPEGVGKTLLDYGCGEALATGRFVTAGYHVALYDPSALMQEKARRFARGETTLYRTAAEIPRQSADVILIVSVLQYLSKDETSDMLRSVHEYLRPVGKLYIADVVPPDVSMLRDVYSLLRAGLRDGFFFAALIGLGKTFFSEYRSLRKTAGFTTWSEGEFLALLAARGFQGVRMPHNIGHNQGRMTFCATIAA